MKLPKKVRILGVDWPIESPNKDLETRVRFAETDHNQQLIRVADDKPLGRQRESLIHELIHASADAMLVDGQELSEQQIRVIARCLHQIFADNPEVLAFLSSEEAV